MAQTANLNLPLIDETMTADVPRDMNALAQAVDVAVTGALADITVPDATTNTKGVVQLEDSVTSTSTTRAATPNAVNKAFDQAITANTTANAANLAATSADGKVDTHAGLTTAHGAVSTATANRIMLRDSAGRAKVAAPAAADDIARKDTVDNAVGPLSSLLTSAKGNAVAAINELFTNANNLKSDWAGVIGSPLLATDTSAQLKAKTQTIKDTMASNLTAKGVAATGVETVTALAQKIGQIVTGMKHATGVISVGSSENSGTISGLAFAPKIAILFRPNAGSNARAFSVSIDLEYFFPNNPFSTYKEYCINGYVSQVGNSAQIIEAFGLETHSRLLASSFKWSYPTYYIGGEHYWLAFGV